MQIRRWLLAGGIAILVLAAGFMAFRGGPLGGAKTYVNLGPKEFQELIRDEEVMVINVHIPFQGDIPGTEHQIPYDQMEKAQNRLPANRTVKLAIYCMSGRMSEMAAKDLLQLGYSEIYNLEGGMIAWKQAGFALSEMGK